MTGVFASFNMKTNKTGDKRVKNPEEIALFNDYQDIKFSLFFGEKSKDGWCPYHCSLSTLNSSRSNFKVLYASNNNSILTEMSVADRQDLVDFAEKLSSMEDTTHNFKSGTHDFELKITKNTDIYSVTATLDLFTMNEDKLESGHGDSQLAISFKCTQSEIEAFTTKIKAGA